jgi:lipopolysaccharide export system protein LptA
MKKPYLIFLLLAALVRPAAAQIGSDPADSTPSPFALAPAALRCTNSPDMTETEILSESAYFDLKGRTAIYMGDVKVRDPRMDMACELLTVHMAPSGGKFDSIVAETNVSIDFLDEKGQKVHGTGGKAIYTYYVMGNYTNDVLQLMENPVLKTTQGDWYGDIIKLDRVNNTISGTHSRMVIRNSTGDTNNIIPAPMP